MTMILTSFNLAFLGNFLNVSLFFHSGPYQLVLFSLMVKVIFK